MTRQEANYKAGQNQHLVGNMYKTSEDEILKIESVMLWDIGHDKFETHAFFQMDEDFDNFIPHINIDYITAPLYNRI